MCMQTAGEIERLHVAVWLGRLSSYFGTCKKWDGQTVRSPAEQRPHDTCAGAVRNYALILLAEGRCGWLQLRHPHPEPGA